MIIDTNKRTPFWSKVGRPGRQHNTRQNNVFWYREGIYLLNIRMTSIIIWHSEWRVSMQTVTWWNILFILLIFDISIFRHFIFYIFVYLMFLTINQTKSNTIYFCDDKVKNKNYHWLTSKWNDNFFSRKGKLLMNLDLYSSFGYFDGYKDMRSYLSYGI